MNELKDLKPHKVGRIYYYVLIFQIEGVKIETLISRNQFLKLKKEKESRMMLGLRIKKGDVNE